MPSPNPNPRPNPPDALAALLWLWALGRRPLNAVLSDLKTWPRYYRPRARA